MNDEDRALIELLMADNGLEQPRNQAVSTGDRIPLSLSQRRLWFLQQYEPDSCAYNITHAFAIDGPLDVARVRDAFRMLVERHAILRTVFQEVDGIPYQIIRAENDFAFAHYNVANVGNATQVGWQARLVEQEAMRPFAIDGGALFRVAVYSASASEHCLVVAVHHLISDGWSNALWAKDLGEAYALSTPGGGASLRPLPIQYADYALRQQGYLSGEQVQRDLAYWHRYLGDTLPVLNLASDRSRPAVLGASGAGIGFQMPVHTASDLTAFCARESVTPFVVCLAAFQLLLARYSNQDEFFVGVPVAGRHWPEVQNLIGLFINTQVYRARLRQDRTVRDWLREVQDDAIGALNHPDLPFDHLVDSLSLPRQSNRHPLFQVSFDFRDERVPVSLAFEGLAVQPLADDSDQSKFDVMLHVGLGADGIDGRLVMNGDLFDNATVARWADEYRQWLDIVMGQPTRMIGALPVPGAPNPIDPSWQASRVARAASGAFVHGLVHERIAEQASAHAARIALTFGDASLPYGELEARANRLAHFLIKRGVGPDVCVGVALARSSEMIVGLLAILKAGGAYVPLDPEYPAERLTYMIEHSKLRLLLTQSWVRPQLGLPATVEAIDLDTMDVSAESVACPASIVGPENLAYVIYTSGSTGRPKGVMVSHAALGNFLSGMQMTFALNHADCLVAVTSLSFDIAALELFLPLTAGARVVIASRDVARDGHALVRLLDDSAATIMQATPATWRMLLAAGWAGRAIKGLCGGEALSQDLSDTLRALGVDLWNMYGPTETTIWSSCQHVDAPPSLGRPIAATQLRVLDGAMRAVPVGVAGELYIGGAGLARGYLHRADLTAERFVPDPFDAGGGRLYRTGDLVRWDAAGALTYLGRIDHQVKIRGFRIELGEVEACLLAQAGVREAIVTALEDAETSRLLAYVTVWPGTISTPADLRMAVSHALPDYMVPSVVTILDALPMTPNGKVDRRALPIPVFQLPGYAPPEGDVEERLARIWQEVLGVARVGRHDNFFALGGDSILSLQIVARARQDGWPIGARLLFERQTPAELARALVLSASTSEPPLLPVARDAQMALSYAQQRLWFLWNLKPESSAYHIAGGLILRGALNIEALQAAMHDVVQQQEALRTTFVTATDGSPRQVIHAALPYDWRYVDLSLDASLSDALSDSLEDATQAWAENVAQEAFDLRTGPLLRMGVARRHAGEHVLVVSMHHIVSDGWSVKLLLERVVDAYGVRLSRTHEADRGTGTLPTLPVQYADYAAWQRQWLDAGEGSRQLTYWREQLVTEDGAQPVLALPVDRPRQAAGTYRAATHDITLPPDLDEAVRSAARRLSTTPFVVLLAAFQALLYRHSGQTDIRVGVPLANRERTEVAGLIGFFVNTQVLRAQVDGNTTVSALLDQVKARAQGAQAHADLPFDRLVDALQPERSLGHTPLFQVMFNHQKTDISALARLPGLDVATYDTGERAAQFELTLNTEEQGHGSLSGTLTYASELFDASTIDRLGRHYVAMLQAMTDDGDCRVSDVPLLDRAAQATLLSWGGEKQVHPYVMSVHERIAQEAQRHPERIAVVCGDAALRYGELDAQANRLAHRLVRLGVGPEIRVGIAVERSIALVVGLLAILKAGGAYVPLDPSYPEDRLAYMLQDSGVGVLLTQSHLVATLPVPDDVRIIELDSTDVSDEPESAPHVAVHADNVAYVIYTSGSTGRPKGAQLTHANVSRLLAATQRWFDFDASDVWTMFHSYAFDFSVWELFGALCHGGKLVVVPYLVSREPEAFVQLLQREGVTVLNQTPSAFRQLMQVPQIYDAGLPLRVVIFGGEALDPQTLASWVAHFGDTAPRLVNMYGITETTVHVTYRPVAKADTEAQRSPIGEAISDLGLYVLDTSGKLAPVGVAGELHVSGAGLARGYLNRPSLTAERFIPNPFSDKGERLYRTGDLTRWTQHGELDYLGRIDHQVKIRGFRIELGEIEAQLLALDGVREAVVLTQEGPGGTRLLAYVTAQRGRAVASQTLRSQLGDILPDYMVPAVLMVLDALPLTSNGKVDRRALPEPTYEARGYAAPQGAVETALACIWQDVLAIERVGRHDNFFELGGHSLLAIQLLAQLRASGWAADVQTLFQRPRLMDFAESVTARRTETQSITSSSQGIPPACVAIEPQMLSLVPMDVAEIRLLEASVAGGAANIQDIYPLAPLQQGILFHHMVQAEGDIYVQSELLSFTTRSRLDRFIASVDQVIARHDILRTSVHWRQLTQPVQVVQRTAHLPVQWWDPDASGDVEARLNAHIDPRHYRIDVGQAPMVRAVAVHDKAADRWLLQLTSHHLALDHTSEDLLLGELTRILQGREAELPPPIPFRRFVEQLQSTAKPEDDLAFFKRLLSDVEEPTAPFGLVDVQGDATDVREETLILDRMLVTSLREQARKAGVSVATLAHLAWAVVVGQLSGRDDVVFGTVLFGRMQAGEGAERALGMFVNTLPVRLQLAGQNVEAGLQQTHALLAALLQHEHTSLSLAQRCSALPPGTPLFSSMLNYRHGVPDDDPEQDRAWDGISVLHFRERTNFPVSMTVNDKGARVELVVHVSGPVDPLRIGRYMQKAVEALVDALTHRPSLPIDAIDLLSDTERQALAKWGCNRRTFDDARSVHALIAAQAARRPDVVAIVCGDTRVSYGQLESRANQLAHRLVAMGVGPDVLVGVAMERSVDMIVGLLAILKAGGAYVPLDPAYPAERLSYMLTDSGCRLLLTQSAVRDRLPIPDGVSAVALDRLDVSDASMQCPPIASAVQGAHLAYVIYTSGSTGHPKGTMISHRALSNFLQSAQDRPGISSDDTLVAVTSLSFDIAALELYLPLIAGARVVLASGADARDGNALAALLTRHEATLFQSTPSTWRMLLETAWDPRATSASFRGLCGGEALPEELATRLCQRGVALWNMYGPTETTIWSAAGPLTEGTTPTLGAPFAATTLRVVDRNLNPVPTGVAGELYIGGRGLARGYLNRPGVTASRFVPDPFDEHGARLYRTGDLVRWTEDGELVYLGRIDHQVKIRGFRIELGEIESQLAAQAGVREAVVKAQEDAQGARLIAYVTAHRDVVLDASALRTALAAALPAHMVPSAIVVLDALPMTPNGKIDRKALPAAEHREKAYEAPQGEVEETLARIWTTVLGAAQVSRHDDFFALGGHSLLAMKVQRDVTALLQIEVPLRTFFARTALTDLARACAEARDQQGDAVNHDLDTMRDLLGELAD